MKHLGKEVQRQFGKQRWRVFNSRKNLFQCSGKCHGQWYRKFPWSLSHSWQIKHLLCHWVFLYLWYPVAPRELLLLTQEVAEQCQHQDQPRDQRCCSAAPGWEHHAAAQLCPLHGLPSGSCSESLDLSPGKWEGNSITKKKKSVTHCKKVKEKSNGPVTGVAWCLHRLDCQVLTQF